MIKSLSLIIFVLWCLEFQGVNAWKWVIDEDGDKVTCKYGAEKERVDCPAKYNGSCKYNIDTYFYCLCLNGTEQYQLGGKCMTSDEIKEEKDMIENYPTIKTKNTELQTEKDNLETKVKNFETQVHTLQVNEIKQEREISNYASQVDTLKKTEEKNANEIKLLGSQMEDLKVKEIEQNNKISNYEKQVHTLVNTEKANTKEIKLLKEAKHWLQNYAPQPFQMEDDFRKNFNIALVGQTSSGKSSLNNTLRGLTPADRNNPNVNYALVNDEQCTMETTKYQYFGSQCKQEVNIWDLPGIGTEEHERKEYLQNNGLRWYNLVLFLISGPWMDHDTIIAKDLIHNGVKFVIIRSKIGLSIENDMYDNQETEEECLANKKEKLHQKLDEAKKSLLKDAENHKDKKHNIVNYSVENQQIFSLDCRSIAQEKWDFPKFKSFVLKQMADYDHEQSINETALKYEQHEKENKQNKE